jgi:hypothetical protein
MDAPRAALTGRAAGADAPGRDLQDEIGGLERDTDDPRAGQVWEE